MERNEIMWVKTSSGKIVNLDRFDTVEQKDGALVATRFEKGQQLQYPEELATGTPEELADLVGRFARFLNSDKENMRYCDLTAKPKAVGAVGRQTVSVSDGFGNVRELGG
jgi:hypothetical protein